MSAGRPELEPIGRDALHVVCDMQRLFAERTPWQVPSLSRIVPQIGALAEAHASATLFTRFLPPRRAAEASGRWRRYYEHWSSVTLDRLDERLLELVPPLAGLARAGEICDKTTYSAFASEAFRAALARRRARTLIFSGVETDVCVLASVLPAVDHGYRVIVAVDAVASASPGGHRATIEDVLPRLDRQVELASTDHVLAAWPPARGGGP